MLDRTDRAILGILQEDATLPLAAIAQRVNLSTTPCWRRIQRLERGGYILRRVALLDRNKVNAGVTVFVAIRTARHSMEWFEAFNRAIADIPEIVEAYRMSGEVDYLLRILVPSIAAYDAVYKTLISRVDFTDVSSSFAMENLKYTTTVPLHYLEGAG